MNRAHDVADRDKVEDDPQCDAEIQQKWDEPAIVVSVQDQSCDPPSGDVSCEEEGLAMKLNVPSEQEPYEYLSEYLPFREVPRESFR